jgi:hypothetical protein
MNVRYAVVGCCFVTAAILMIVSANSNGGKDECRYWSARSVVSVFMPCVDRVEVNDPFNIGTALTKQQVPNTALSERPSRDRERT